MAFGYEGFIKLGTHYVLGTGGSVPRTRVRLESSAGYGGKIKSPESEIGIGSPFNYDWEQYDGSINFELTGDVFELELKPWIFDRQNYKEINLSSRKDNVQQFLKCFFNSISISANEGSVLDSSVGFISLERDSYTWGNLYENNRKNNLLCTANNFPEPLNITNKKNMVPIPYWNTIVKITENNTEVRKNFTSWSVEFSQDIVKFFGCNNNANVQEPLYLACGPMSVSFSGTYMDDFTGASNGFLSDSLKQVEIDLAGKSIKLLRLEATTEKDDVQAKDSLAPLSVDYVAYEIKS